MRTEIRRPAPVPVATHDEVFGETTFWTPPAVNSERPRMHNALLFTIIALVIGLIGLLYLVQTSKVASLGYEVTRLEQERAAKSLENQQLSYQVAQLQALPVVEGIAGDELQMQPMDAYLFLTVPLPLNDELPQTEGTPEPGPSRLERVWNRLTGRGEAVHAESTP